MITGVHEAVSEAVSDVVSDAVSDVHEAAVPYTHLTLPTSFTV